MTNPTHVGGRPVYCELIEEVILDSRLLLEAIEQAIESQKKQIRTTNNLRKQGLIQITGVMNPERRAFIVLLNTLKREIQEHMDYIYEEELNYD